MLLEQAQVQIRVRDHLETLDLAIAIWRRHLPGLALCASVGIGPAVALDLWFLWEGMDNGYLYVCLLMLQIPWATAFITLYLGQAVLESKVSYKRIAFDWLGSLPKLLVYQGLLRGLCAVFWPLWLYIALRMKYSNEIILLERDGFRATSNRNSKFHSAITGRLTNELIVDGILFVVMQIALSHGLSQLWDLVADRSRDSFVESIESDGMFEYFAAPLGGWRGLTAFWLSIAFFAVARFLGYLDARIRREGWDVEMKLLAQGQRIEAGWQPT